MCFNPKAQGAWNLHEATVAAEVDLDFFMMLSSISSILGLFGQLNYAAANYFQDSLAQYRRQLGLAATSVNLGVLGQYAGMSSAANDQQDIIGVLESQGLYVMSLDDVMAKFEQALIQQPVQRMTARIDWPWFRLAYPHLVRDARFINFMSDSAVAASVRPKGTGLRTQLLELELDERLQRLQEELAVALARILDAQPDRIDVASSIDSLGLDSLMLTEYQVSIMRALDINVPLIKLLKGPSIESLASELVTQLDSDASDPSSSSANEPSAEFTLADVDGISIINPWLIRGQGDPEAAARLVCFHSMGVGASLFTNFLVRPPKGYDILAVQTPGRENRMHEPVMENITELTDQVAQHLMPHLDRHVVFWGHSFGGTVAWEVIRRLREEYGWEPHHFVVSGTAGPHLMYKWQTRELLLKTLVTDNSPEYLISLSRFVDDPEFLKSIIPLMRIDYPLLEGYRYEERPPLSCPITAFAARRDDFVYTDEIRQWDQHTRGGFDLIEVDGDHWFLSRNRDQIIATFEQIALGCSNRRPIHVVPSPSV